jgi:hypothetical protein
MLRQLVLSLTDVIISLVELLIGLRVVLKLFGASTRAPFVSWVYETTQPLLTPFIGMFPSPKLDGVFLIEFSALFALIVYGLAGYLISNIISSISQLPRGAGHNGRHK